MSAGWVAGTVRARAMARRRLAEGIAIYGLVVAIILIGGA